MAWLLAPVTLPAWTLLAGDGLVLAEAALVACCLWALLRGKRVVLVREGRPVRRPVQGE